MKKKLAVIMLFVLLFLIGKAEALTLTQKLGNEYIVTTVEQGEKVNMSFISKIGFQFRNWVISGVTGIDTTSPTINFQIGTQNVTIEAKYDEKYQISFNSMGGNENINTIEVVAGNSKTIPLTTLTKEGHTFLGWATEKDGDVEFIGGESIKPEEDIILYAKWRINQYTITFNTNGGTSISSITQDYGTIIEKPDDPLKTDYKFIGWDKEIPDKMPAENLTITALWEENIAQAIYIAEDKSLNFIRGKLKTTSDTHNDKPITAVYTGIETREYNGSQMAWDTYASEITTINFEAEIKPVSTGVWFYNFTNLTEINGLEKLNTSNVNNMGYMFNGCSSLTSLDLSSFNTSNVTQMQAMFYGCSSLTSLDLSNFNTSKVDRMHKMFYECSGLTNLNLSSFNTSKVILMYEMFYNCSSLSSLNLSGFDTSSLTSIYSMFYGCNTLSSLDLSSFDTSKVTHMYRMFYGCSSLSSLDLSNFDTGKITNMNSMFDGMIRLQEVKLGEKFSFVGTSGYLPAPSSTYIAGADGYWYNADGDSFAPSEVVSNKVDTYYGYSEIPLMATEETAWFTQGGTSIAKSKITSIALVDSYAPGTVVASWNGSKNKKQDLMVYVEDDGKGAGTYKITIAGNGMGKIRADISCSKIFYQFTAVTKITGLDILDTSKVTNMHWFFRECRVLSYVDVSKFDTSKVTDMYGIFHTTSLSENEIDVSRWDTSKVTTMQGLFNNCQKITKLDLSNWDTSSLTNTVNMFYICKNLTELDLSSFNMSKISNMNQMFTGAFSLQKITLGANFKFVGTGGYLPTPNASYITGADGANWYNSLGEPFTPTNIPTGKADTYYAASNLVP